MREAAELAEACRGFLEIDRGEGIGFGAVGADAEPVEKGLSNQMRGFARRLADADIDAGFAKKHRLQLRVGIGHVQDARIAETFELIEARLVGRARHPRQASRQRHGAGGFQKIPPADFHWRTRLTPLPRRQNSSEFPYPSSVPSRWWPGTPRPSPAPRLRLPRWPRRRNRRRSPLSSRPRAGLPSSSICRATGRLASRRLRRRQKPPCNRPRKRRAPASRPRWTTRRTTPRPAWYSGACSWSCSWTCS